MSVDFLGGQGDVSFDTTSTLHPELEYYLRIESPGSGVRGSLSMTWPRVPPHFACDLDDELLVHSHGIAWSNAITDSDANLELSVGNEKLSWSDTVYHDRVWATAYISPENQQSFYWGRGRLGDRCNVIWSSVREQDGKMTNSGSVAADGEIHSAGCECEAVQVKAWAEEGKQSPSPPMPKTPVPVRIAITADLGEENGELCLPVFRKWTAGKQSFNRRRWRDVGRTCWVGDSSIAASMIISEQSDEALSEKINCSNISPDSIMAYHLVRAGPCI